LRHSVRGSGFPRDIALGNELHPVVLLQVLLPGVLGSLRAPVEEWWGGRFYTKGFPYFLSLYLGPCALGLAAAGWSGPDRRRRYVLAGAGLVGLWYALGAGGGLALAVSYLPPVQWFRFPSKALLMPYLAVALFAGFGADRLRRGGGWRALAVVSLAAAAVAGVVAVVPRVAPDVMAQALAIPREAAARAGRSASLDAVIIAGASVFLTALSFLVLKNRLAPARGAAALTVLVVADLTRAGLGMNPQVTPEFYALLPEIRSLRLDALSGGRVFSYGLDASPSFRRFLASGTPGLGLWSFFLSRQVVAPYANVIDRVELAFGKDLTAFLPRAPELDAEEYDPARVGQILGRLRSAAVTRVVSLDRLAHPDLGLIAEIPAGPPAVALHVYALAASWPRSYVACRVVPASGAEDALGRALAADVRPDLDVILEAPAPAGCTRGSVTRASSAPGDEEYGVESDGPAVLVTRDSFAPGWTATVDGQEVGVLRANGKHRAVPLAAGRHRVRLRYAPPVLFPAVWATVVAAAAAAFIAVRGKRGGS
jgi:membrane protein YfhO